MTKCLLAEAEYGWRNLTLGPTVGLHDSPPTRWSRTFQQSVESLIPLRQILMRNADRWQSLAEKLSNQIIDLAA
jgi:hypothetical protein